MIPYLLSDILTSLPNIRHGFFTRLGGVSTAPYESLNCSFGSGDDPAHIQENRRRIATTFDKETRQLCVTHQYHSAEVVIVTTSWLPANAPKADAMVTREHNIALMILTADCVPILLADPVHRVIAAVHAGWRGAALGIIPATLRAMIALGAHPKHIHAAVGPAISQASYQVDSQFRAQFLQIHPHFQDAFAPDSENDKYRFDLKACVMKQLREGGLAAVNMLEHDTYTDEARFFSFRRSTHRQEKDYGRQASVIMLNDH